MGKLNFQCHMTLQKSFLYADLLLKKHSDYSLLVYGHMYTWFYHPYYKLIGLCLLNDDSGLCISSMQKRMLFAGFTAAKKTIIQNWFTPHMCGKTYWIHSLLQIVTYECTTARINGAKPSTIDAWQCFLFGIRDCIKEWLLCFSCPSLSPSLLTGLLRCWVYVCCFVLLYFGCCVMML